MSELEKARALKPLCIDLYCGLGGWAEGFLAEGYDVIGFDIERHDYGDGGYHGHLVLQDVTTLHGSQFRNATVIVASPPCQQYSYMAMPWSKAKELAKWYREKPERIAELNALFDACFRIQREASEAAGRHIPLIVENVRGAQKWVGRAKANFGSYYLWGDVGMVGRRVVAGVPRYGVSVAPVKGARKTPIGSWDLTRQNYNADHSWQSEGLNQGSEAEKTAHCNRKASSGSTSRKRASAEIAKIPWPLAVYIARCFKP